MIPHPTHRRTHIILYLCVLLLLFASGLHAVDKRFRIGVVSSCHPEMVWVQSICEGRCKAFLDHGYLDDQAQAYRAENKVESKHAVIRKWWVDTKQRNKKPEISDALAQITTEIDAFDPDCILLGDDIAAKFGGNQSCGKRPAEISVYAPERGPAVLARERAKNLQIDIPMPTIGGLINEQVDTNSEP